MTIRRWALALLCVCAGWLAVLAAVMVLSGAAPGAIVFFPAGDFAQRLPKDVAIVEAGTTWIAVRGAQPGLGRELYRAGGRLVLPAGLPGCLPLPAGP
ncbi:MAG: hypothetical protein R3210_08550 [Roseovarius sp.]|nr:hypothetical protein [Roseovarius sp.]